MTQTSNVVTKITPADIKAKLTDIQGEANDTVTNVKGKATRIAIAVGVVVVVGVYILGRRGGRKTGTVIELKRA